MTLKNIFTSLCVLVAVLLTACGGEKHAKKATLSDDLDSVSYIVGMNIGYNIQKMDTTLRADAIVKGINDVLKSKEMMSVEDARTYYLAYMTYDVYERVRNYEEQYLSDLKASDNKIQRTKSGLTYKVQKLGDMNNTASSDRDTVVLIYRAERLSGEEVDVVAERDDTMRMALRQLTSGMKEGVKLIGEGGSITLWMPSELAYGAEGNVEKGVNPNEMLRYEVEIVDIIKRRRR